MKHLHKVFFAACLIAAIASCKPDETEVTQETSIANVSLTNASSNNSRVVNFFANGILVSSVTGVTNGGTVLGTYVGVAPGTGTLSARDTATSIGNPEYFSQAYNFEGGKSYAFFLYDTINATTTRMRGLLLTTDRITENNVTTADVRFLNLSPLSPAVDAWFVRQTSNGATPTPALVPKDSVLVSAGAPFVGGLPSIPATLANFTPITASQSANTGSGNLATNYLVRVRLAGSSTLVGTSAGLTLLPGKNYTVIMRNKFPAVSITSVVQN